VAVETGQAIITALWTRLTTDATLKSVLGDPISVYRIMATSEPPFPYFRHRLVINGDLLDGIHTYYLDLWYYGDGPTTPDSAMDRVKILLHEWTFVTEFDEASGFLEWFSGGYIETDAAKVYHYATQWDVRLGATRDITNIVN